MNKILNSTWFGYIGIVKVQTEYDGIKYYIGSAKGENQTDDEQHIADWGNTFPPKAGRAIFGEE